MQLIKETIYFIAICIVAVFITWLMHKTAERVLINKINSDFVSDFKYCETHRDPSCT